MSIHFKLDNDKGELVDLSRYQPTGYVPVPRDANGLMGGATFTIEVQYNEDVFWHIARVFDLNTGVSQTYEYGHVRGRPEHTAECYVKQFQVQGGVLITEFIQTGPITTLETDYA